MATPHSPVRYEGRAIGRSGLDRAKSQWGLVTQGALSGQANQNTMRVYWNGGHKGPGPGPGHGLLSESRIPGSSPEVRIDIPGPGSHGPS